MGFEEAYLRAGPPFMANCWRKNHRVSWTSSVCRVRCKSAISPSDHSFARCCGRTYNFIRIAGVGGEGLLLSRAPVLRYRQALIHHFNFCSSGGDAANTLVEKAQSKSFRSLKPQESEHF